MVTKKLTSLDKHRLQNADYSKDSILKVRLKGSVVKVDLFNYFEVQKIVKKVCLKHDILFLNI